MNWNKERKDSIFEAVSKAPEMEFKLNLPCLVQRRTRRIQASTVQESYSHLKKLIKCNKEHQVMYDA